MEKPTFAFLADGKRLHLHHGPIDLIIGADGAQDHVNAAYGAAVARFETVLDELVSELTILREDMTSFGLGLNGSIALTMQEAVQPHWKWRITPMAAVAGAVAQHILAAMLDGTELNRAHVNNGGDIAIHLAEGQSFTVAAPSGEIVIRPEDGIGGIATSGWKGRSYSLGIADAVTVLADTAAHADAAATLIANAVDLPFSPKVKRQKASELWPDSDLRDRLVTVGVEPLTQDEIFEALGSGVVCLQSLLKERQFFGVSLMLGQEVISLKCDPPKVEEEELEPMPVRVLNFGSP